jgi:hypothetical protein
MVIEVELVVDSALLRVLRPVVEAAHAFRNLLRAHTDPPAAEVAVRSRSLLLGEQMFLGGGGRA